jgi:hypothetical protein
VASTSPTATIPGVLKTTRPQDGGDIARRPEPVAPEPPAVALPAVLSKGGTIKIGVLTWKPVGEVDISGYGYIAPDPKPVIDALIAEVNAKGGIAGRQVTVAVTAGFDPTGTSHAQFARSENEACVRLTEDDRVFLVLSIDGFGWMARHCYAHHRTPYLGDGFDDHDFKDLKPWLLPSRYTNIDTLARLYVRAMRDQGFIGPKMGVWVWDMPSFRRSADRVLLPAIKAGGGEVVDVFYSSQATVGEYQLEVSAAALRFQSRGVERVVLWDAGTVWPDFARRAQAQAWFPRYGLHSGLQPHNHLPDVPLLQRRGTVAAGTCPGCDVGDNVFPLTARERECFAVVNRRAGTTFSQRSPRDNGNNILPGATLDLCQLLEMARVALAPATGKALAQAELWDYFSALGDQPPVVTPPQTFFSPNKWDGAEHYAHLAYHEDCDCFRYTSAW